MNKNLIGVFFLSFKAAIACFLALVLNHAVGNPDHVSSTFIAVLTVSPIVLLGIRRAIEGFVDSVVGGLWGTLANLLSLSIWSGVPIAVFLAIISSFLLKMPLGYPVAAFTALYVVIVPWGDPLMTFQVRLVAVLTGAFSGLLANLLISAMLYRKILNRQLNQVEQSIREILPHTVTNGVDMRAEESFAALAALQGEVKLALEELRWRKSKEVETKITSMWWRIENLRYLLHLTCGLGYGIQEGTFQKDKLVDFIGWLKEPIGEPPETSPETQVMVLKIGQIFEKLNTESNIHQLHSP